MYTLHNEMTMLLLLTYCPLILPIPIPTHSHVGTA